MMEKRRALAFAGVVLAAAASIATSPKRWTLSDAKGAVIVLDDANPKASVHVTAMNTHRAEHRFTALITWPSASSRGEVRFIGKSDDGVHTFDSVGAPFAVEGGAVAAQTHLAHQFQCPAACSRGYTLSFERTRQPGERIEIEWKLEASTREIGDQPPGASVSVRIDPPPP